MPASSGQAGDPGPAAPKAEPVADSSPAAGNRRTTHPSLALQHPDR